MSIYMVVFQTRSEILTRYKGNSITPFVAKYCHNNHLRYLEFGKKNPANASAVEEALKTKVIVFLIEYYIYLNLYIFSLSIFLFVFFIYLICASFKLKCEPKKFTKSVHTN